MLNAAGGVGSKERCCGGPACNHPNMLGRGKHNVRQCSAGTTTPETAQAFCSMRRFESYLPVVAQRCCGRMRWHRRGQSASTTDDAVTVAAGLPVQYRAAAEQLTEIHADNISRRGEAESCTDCLLLCCCHACIGSVRILGGGGVSTMAMHGDLPPHQAWR